MAIPDIATVLVVEDEPDLSELVTMEFSIRGHRTYTAHDGRQALSITREQPVNLIVTDVRMPNMSGLELLDTLKAEDPFNPAVIFISAYADIELPEVYGRGAEGFFTKPFHLRSLAERADCLLARQRAPWCEEAPLNSEGAPVRLEALRDGAKALLGRGGAGLVIPGFPLAHPDQRVRIAFSSTELGGAPIEGHGKVQWVHDTGESATEYGVEFEALYGNGRDQYMAWLASARPIPYIPSSARG